MVNTKVIYYWYLLIGRRIVIEKWFIFKEKFHLGPFSKKEILKLYKSGDINSQTLFWKEDLDDWIDYNQFIKSKKLKLNKLEEIKTEDYTSSQFKIDRLKTNAVITYTKKKAKQNIVKNVKTSSNKELRIEDIPLPNLNKDLSPSINDKDISELTELNKVNKYNNKFHIKKYFLTFVAFSLIIFSLVSFVILKNYAIYYQSVPATINNSVFNTSEKLNKKVMFLELLNYYFTGEKSSSWSFIQNENNSNINYNKTDKTLEFKSSYPGKVKLHISGRSIENKVISFAEIRFSAQEIFHNGKVSFKNLLLKSGLNIAPGLYKLKVFTKKNEKIKYSWWVFNSNQENLKSINFESEIYIGKHKTIIEFNDDLLSFNKKKSSQNKEIFEEVLEKINSMISITGQIESELKTVYMVGKNLNKRRSAYLKLNNNFNKMYSPLLSNMLVDSRKQSAKYKGKYSFAYTQLSDFNLTLKKLLRFISNEITLLKKNMNNRKDMHNLKVNNQAFLFDIKQSLFLKKFQIQDKISEL
jgi:hypothetical protein